MCTSAADAVWDFWTIPCPIKSSLIFSPFVWPGVFPNVHFPVMSSGSDLQKSTGMGSVPTGGGGGSAPLTLPGVLSLYTSSPNPPVAALEQVISERNVLSSQNSQLWKLVEKQRSGYSQILKELERVRSERDTFKTRLTSLGENPDKILKKQKASKGNHSGNTLKPSSSHSGLRSDDQPKAALEDPRQTMTRHQSEDSGMRLHSRVSTNTT
jgi:RalA-binding protein 1